MYEMKHGLKIIFTALLILVIYSSSISALESKNRYHEILNNRDLDIGRFDGNRIRNELENNGMIVSHRVTDHPGMEWPQGSYKYINFASGIWLAGYVQGDLRTAVAEYGPEFMPGNFGSDPYDGNYRIYKINSYDFSNPYSNPDFVNWPVNQGAPWIDNNNDGIYNVDDGDHPEILGDQMLWYVMNDGETSGHSIFSTLPLNVEMQTTIWGYDRIDHFGDMMFVKSLIINKGNESIDSMYISIWDDPDIGDAGDDFVGCDTLLSLGYCYNAGDDYDYGVKVPAIGYDFLQGPIVPSVGDTAIAYGQYISNYRNLSMTSFIKYINGDTVWSDPIDAFEAYNYMQGLLKDGSPLPFEATGGSPFAHPGDPNLDTGINDTEYIDGDLHVSGDRRFLMNTGPLTMAPGDSQEVIFGILIGRGEDALSSITRLKYVDQLTQSVADNFYVLPEDTSYDQFSEINEIYLVGDNLNDDGQANNGESIRVTFELLNFSVDTASFYALITPQSSMVYEEGFNSITIDNVPSLNDYTIPDSLAFQFFIDPGFTGDSITFRIIVENMNTSLWNYHTVSLPVEVVVWTPDNEVYWADHIDGNAESRLGYRVVEPAATTNHMYSVYFTPDHYDDTGQLVSGLGLSLFDETTSDLLLDKHELPGPYQFGFPITDGFKLVVEDVPLDLKSISVVENAAGTLDPPQDAVAYWNFDRYLVADGTYDNQQTDGNVWFFNVGPMYGVDQDALIDYVFMYTGGYGAAGGSGLQWLIPDDFEIRFTGNGKAIDYWETGNVVDVPFEWWNIGDADDPADDFQMIPYLLDEDANGEWNLQYGSEDADHGTSGALNDPWSDRVYVLSPTDETPGSQGYNNFMVGAETGSAVPAWYATPGSNDAGGPMDAWNAFSRTVFMLVNGGDVTTATSPLDYSAQSLEIGTVFRIITNKPIATDDMFQFTTEFLATESEDLIPNEFKLFQNYPNPFNPYTTIHYNLPRQSHVSITIYNLLGRQVKTLISKTQDAGFKSITWDASNVSSGMYFYRIKAGDFIQTRKMIVLK